MNLCVSVSGALIYDLVNNNDRAITMFCAFRTIVIKVFPFGFGQVATYADEASIETVSPRFRFSEWETQHIHLK